CRSRCRLYENRFVLALGGLQERPGVHTPVELHEGSNDARPASLMVSADAGAVVAMKVFVERNEVAPMGVGLELLGSSIDRTASVRVAQKNPLHAIHDLLAHLKQVHLLSRARRTLHLEAVAVIEVKLLQRVDHQHLHRHPDWSSPIGIAPVHGVVRLRGEIIHAELLAMHIQHVRVIGVIPRAGSNSVRAQELILIEHPAQQPPEAVRIYERKNLSTVYSEVFWAGGMDAGSNFRQSQ